MKVKYRPVLCVFFPWIFLCCLHLQKWYWNTKSEFNVNYFDFLVSFSKIMLNKIQDLCHEQNIIKDVNKQEKDKSDQFSLSIISFVTLDLQNLMTSYLSIHVYYMDILCNFHKNQLKMFFSYTVYRLTDRRTNSNDNITSQNWDHGLQEQGAHLTMCKKPVI